MRHFLITAALTATVATTVGLGALASSAQAQSRYDGRSYYYGPYQSRYRYDYDRRDYDRYRYRYDRDRYRYDRDRYDWGRYDRWNRYDRDRYRRNYYYRDNYYRGYNPYRSGYRGIYVDPNRGLNINTGRFRFNLGW